MMDFEKSYILPFQPEDVFTAWTSSETVIPPATHLEIDPSVGGFYRLFMETSEASSKAQGIFFTVSQDERVRYTWEWDGDGEITEIDVRFERQPDGTRVYIRHSGFRSEESLERHKGGWDSYVEGLSNLLGERQAPPVETAQAES